MESWGSVQLPDFGDHYFSAILTEVARVYVAATVLLLTQ